MIGWDWYDIAGLVLIWAFGLGALIVAWWYRR